MANLPDFLTCSICFEAFTTAAGPPDRRPILFCKNGHTFCSTCATGLNDCPSCREPKLRDTLVNRALIDIVTAHQQSLERDIPEILINHVTVAARPFAGGSYADVFDATWQNQPVALKMLRQQFGSAKILQDVSREARFTMSLNHPNIVRVFGIVTRDDNPGILMEKADHGSLRSHINNLSLDQQVSVSIDIVDGLDYTHSKQVVHRDLKPENILLFKLGSRLIAKIADFGTSKVVQASLTGTASVGTPSYMAPELFEKGVRYGSKIDIYSLSIILYEIFSGCEPYTGFENPMMLLMAVARGQRPEMSNRIPTELRKLIECGWSADQNVRPTLSAFRDALTKLNVPTRPASAKATDARDAAQSIQLRFDTEVDNLEKSLKAYKPGDARSQVEVCRRLWEQLGDKAGGLSAARFHSEKSLVHDWFGEYSNAYAETYKALNELNTACRAGASIKGDQVVRIFSVAVFVCMRQQQFAAAEHLACYAVRYAKANLDAAAYANVLEDLVSLLLNVVMIDNAVKVAEIALSMRQKNSKNKHDIRFATTYDFLAYCLYRQHITDRNFTAALEHAENGLRELNEVDPSNIYSSALKRTKALIIEEVALSCYNTDERNRLLKQAKQLLKDAIHVDKFVLGERNPAVAIGYGNLGRLYQSMRKLPNAERMHRKAIELNEEFFGPNHMNVAVQLGQLANLNFFGLHRYDEAQRFYFREIQIYLSVVGPACPNLRYPYENLMQIYTVLGRPDLVAEYNRKLSEWRTLQQDSNNQSKFPELVKLSTEVLNGNQSKNQVNETLQNVPNVLQKFFKAAPKP